MSKLPFEAFLALRYLRPRRTFVSVITLISTVGVMLGVAVLIIVISVMAGFDREWRNRILGFNAHLKVYQSGSVPLYDFEGVMERVARNANVKGVAPFVQGQVLVRTQPEFGSPRSLAPVLRGIEPEFEPQVSILPESIVHGKFDVEGDGLLIGTEFAGKMNLQVGERVVIYSPGRIEKMIAQKSGEIEEAVLPDEFVVRGIFDVGFSEYNFNIIVSSLEKAQDLYGLDYDSVHGLQVMLHDPFKADAARAELDAKLGGTFMLVTWLEENPYIFEALAIEKNMMFFLLFFIMIVAGFGIVNSQITFVVQKTREIGILKALGASSPQVLWLFLSQSVIIGLFGVSLGFGFAMLVLTYRNPILMFMRQATGFELLPASIYQIYELPALIQPSDVGIICGAAFVTCVLAGLFPAWKASRMQPVEALRYE